MKRKQSTLRLILPLILVGLACSLSPAGTPGAPGTPVVVTATHAPTGTPTAPTAAATATPGAPPPASEVLRVVFTGEDGNLWLFDETRRAVVPITASGGALDVRLSPDGFYAAYTRAGESGTLELWMAPLDGSGEVQLVSSEAFNALYPLAAGVEPARFEWVPGSRSLLLSTRQVTQDGPGLFLYDDLLLFDSGSMQLSTLLAAGGGGGMFSVSPDGARVAFSRPNSVNLVDIDGANLQQELIAFPQVLTYSEFLYYPVPVWSADSSEFYVVIPPSDPRLIPAQPAVVYRVFPGRPAEQVAAIRKASTLGSPIELSSDFLYSAYVRDIGTPKDAQQELIIGLMDGSEPRILASGPAGSFQYAWAPGTDGLVFLQRDPPGLFFAEVVGADVRVRPLFDREQFTGIRWVDASRFVVWGDAGAQWRLLLGDLDGNLMILAEGLARPGVFDAGLAP